MAETDRESTANALASALANAAFVRILARADGDALAAAGVLARALAARETPYQVSVVSTVDARTARLEREPSTPGACSVVIGPSSDYDADDRIHLDAVTAPSSLAAAEAVRALGETPAYVLALAGVAAAGVEPGTDGTEWLLEAATDAAVVTRRPGVAVPTAALAADLACLTLVCAPWSGDGDATRTLVTDVVGEETTELTDDDHRRLASVVALDVVADEAVSDNGAHAVRRAIHPWVTPDAPYATVGGLADVLEATAVSAPGTGVALTIDHGAREAALSTWRDHGRRVHDALEDASTNRYDGLSVVHVPDLEDAVVGPLAALAAAYRAPEDVVLAVGTDVAGVATVGERAAAPVASKAAASLECTWDGGPRYGVVGPLDERPAADVIEEVRAVV